MPLPPLVEPMDALDADESIRTARHRALIGFGDVAQRRLAAAHVAVVGAGGLGSPAVLALAAAGVGRLTVIDDDVVDASNLQRQIMHRVSDVGAPKTDSVRRVAADLSPTTAVRTRTSRLDAANAVDLLGGADVVIDGSDTFDTRVAVAEACAELGVPLVWGVVQEFHAQVTVFWSAPPAGVAPIGLSDLHRPDAVGDVPTCAQVGVLGALCVQVGGILATEAIKLITGVGDPLFGRVQIIDALHGRVDTIPLRPATATSAPPSPPTVEVPHLDGVTAAARHNAGAVILDVREPDETVLGVIAGSLLVPLGDVLADPARLGPGPFVVVCRAGVRAHRAAAALVAVGADAAVLSGGIAAWTRGMVRA